MIKNKKLKNGFIVKMDADSQIKEVIFNSLSADINFSRENLTKFIEKGSLKKYFALLNEAKENEVIFGREIDLKLRDKRESYVFTILNNLDEDNIVIAANQSEDLIKYYEELMKINNEYVNTLRNNIKEKINNSRPTSDEEIYNEISKLNSDLVNLQRQLNKQNSLLKAEKEKYRITLESIAEGVITADNENNIVYLNSKAEEMLDWSLEKARGEKCRSVFKVFIQNSNGYNLEMISASDSEAELSEVILSSLLKEKSEINNQEAVLTPRNNQSFPIEFSAAKIEESRGKVIIFRDISERKDTEKRLKKYASTDLLTEVLNRRAGLKYLQREMNLVELNNYTLAIIFIDVNDLKLVNDNFGHQEGDKLLQQVSDILQQSIRKNDKVVRLGGDEFLLILPQSNKAAAEKIWERIQKEFEKVSAENNKDYKISVSHGAVEYSPDYKKSLDQLIKKADKRMYEEKKKIKSERTD